MFAHLCALSLSLAAIIIISIYSSFHSGDFLCLEKREEMDNTTKRRKESFYANRIILAPMVRVSALPMRLLALRFGADLVYTEEIVDFKLMRSKRYINEELNTIDYIDDFGAVIFRTCEEEKDRVVLQVCLPTFVAPFTIFYCCFSDWNQ